MTTTRVNEEDDKTLVSQPAPDLPEDHPTWPVPPLAPVSSNPPPELSGLPAMRAPALPADLLVVQLPEDDSSE